MNHNHTMSCPVIFASQVSDLPFSPTFSLFSFRAARSPRKPMAKSNHTQPYVKVLISSSYRTGGFCYGSVIHRYVGSTNKFEIIIIAIVVHETLVVTLIFCKQTYRSNSHRLGSFWAIKTACTTLTLHSLCVSLQLQEEHLRVEHLFRLSHLALQEWSPFPGAHLPKSWGPKASS